MGHVRSVVKDGNARGNSVVIEQCTSGIAVVFLQDGKDVSDRCPLWKLTFDRSIADRLSDRREEFEFDVHQSDSVSATSLMSRRSTVSVVGWPLSFHPRNS